MSGGIEENAEEIGLRLVISFSGLRCRAQLGEGRHGTDTLPGCQW